MISITISNDRSNSSDGPRSSMYSGKKEVTEVWGWNLEEARYIYC